MKKKTSSAKSTTLNQRNKPRNRSSQFFKKIYSVVEHGYNKSLDVPTGIIKNVDKLILDNYQTKTIQLKTPILLGQDFFFFLFLNLSFFGEKNLLL